MNTGFAGDAMSFHQNKHKRSTTVNNQSKITQARTYTHKEKLMWHALYVMLINKSNKQN